MLSTAPRALSLTVFCWPADLTADSIVAIATPIINRYMALPFASFYALPMLHAIEAATREVDLLGILELTEYPFFAGDCHIIAARLKFELRGVGLPAVLVSGKVSQTPDEGHTALCIPFERNMARSKDRGVVIIDVGAHCPFPLVVHLPVFDPEGPISLQLPRVSQHTHSSNSKFFELQLAHKNAEPGILCFTTQQNSKVPELASQKKLSVFYSLKELPFHSLRSQILSIASDRELMLKSRDIHGQEAAAMRVWYESGRYNFEIRCNRSALLQHEVRTEEDKRNNTATWTPKITPKTFEPPALPDVVKQKITGSMAIYCNIFGLPPGGIGVAIEILERAMQYWKPT